MKLQIIRRPKYLARCLPLHPTHNPRTLPQPRPQHRMLQISLAPPPATQSQTAPPSNCSPAHESAEIQTTSSESASAQPATPRRPAHTPRPAPSQSVPDRTRRSCHTAFETLRPVKTPHQNTLPQNMSVHRLRYIRPRRIRPQAQLRIQREQLIRVVVIRPAAPAPIPMYPTFLPRFSACTDPSGNCA